MLQAVSSELTIHLVTIFLLAAASFSLSMLLTPIYTFFTYHYKLWMVPRTLAVTGEEAPFLARLFAAKYRRNLPVMAGLIFVFVITIVMLAFGAQNAQTWFLIAGLVGGGMVGFIGDFINLRGLAGGRLRVLLKLVLITAIGLIGGWMFYYYFGQTSIHLPFTPNDVQIGWFIVPLFALAIVATGNAINITDGPDGLAGGLAAIAFGYFGVIALMQANIGVAGFCFTTVGALISYVWFNIFPARFLMSGVGSFALGTSLAGVAMLTDTLFLLPIIGFVFVADTATSLLQIFSKKIFKKKIFLSAPIHYHLQLVGWPETKVTMRFWIVGQMCGVLGLIVALLGSFI